MSSFKSPQFIGDPKLEACAISNAAHIVPGSVGGHVAKIQIALAKAGQTIDPTEIAGKRYGASTTAAVVAFKSGLGLLNYAGQIDNIVGIKTVLALDAVMARTLPPGPSPSPPAPPPPPPGPPKVFIVHDVRLFGWRPNGDVLEVNGDTPLRWLVQNVISRGEANGGNLVLKIMAHGLPGFVQCCQGAFTHPTLPVAITDPNKNGLYIGPGKGGMSVADLNTLAAMKGFVKRIEFHSCLVARIGPCFEANGHASYDGNAFCFRLAQRTGAEVVASIHLQYYWGGSGPNNGMHFGTWNGMVFTWAPAGNIASRQDFPYKELTGPPPPNTPPT